MMDVIKLAGDWAPCGRKVDEQSFPAKLIVNLEGPLLTCDFLKQPCAQKAGPSLHHNSLPKHKDPGVLVLANNHLMDYGVTGLSESIRIIEQEKWRYAGAGYSKTSASAPLVFEWDGTRVGVLARCEIQFGIATDTKPGVAGFDSTIYSAIRNLKKETDIVIASVHAAAEMCPWPSPCRQDTWRALVEAGADVVHGHHAHVPQGWEEYQGGLIFYGLGNFCVDPVKWSWHPNGLWSLAPELSLAEGRIAMKPATTVIDDLGDTIRVRGAEPDEAKKHQNYLAECNGPLMDRRLLEGLWQEASLRMYQVHYSDWLGFDSPLQKKVRRIVRGLLSQAKRMMLRGNANSHSAGTISHGQYLLWYHLFACDSHNDAIATALGVLGGELEDFRTEETARLVDEMMPSK